MSRSGSGLSPDGWLPHASCVRRTPASVRLSFFCRCLALFLAAGCAPAGVRAPSSTPQEGHYHVVRPGENLFRIAQSHHLSYAELARVNAIKDPRRIVVGQRLFIPGRVPLRRAAESSVISSSDDRGSVAEAESAFLWPVSGSLNSGFGPRGSGFHDGVDIAAPEGAPIHAVDQGEVIYSDQLRGYGNMVILRHGGGIVSVYAHNQVNLVREGQRVARGEIIARVGSTGRVTGPHLHFEIRKNNLAQDPLLYLPRLCCVPASDMVTPEG